MTISYNDVCILALPTITTDTNQKLSKLFYDFHRDGGGKVDREDIVLGLQLTFDKNGSTSDPQTIRDTVYSIWPTFDHDSSGHIDRKQFCASGGLGEILLEMVNSSGIDGGGGGNGGKATIATKVEPEMPDNPFTYGQQSSQPQSQQFSVPIPDGITPGRKMNVIITPGDLPKEMTVPEVMEWKYGPDNKPYFLTPMELVPLTVQTVQATAVPVALLSSTGTASTGATTLSPSAAKMERGKNSKSQANSNTGYGVCADCGPDCGDCGGCDCAVS